MEGSARLAACNLSHSLTSHLSVELVGNKRSHSVMEAGLVVTGSPGACGCVCVGVCSGGGCLPRDFDSGHMMLPSSAAGQWRGENSWETMG